MKNCLLNAPMNGALWLIFLFVFCFLGVHLVRLAKIGWKYQKNRGGETRPRETAAPERSGSPSRASSANEPPAPEKKEDAPERSAPEPVYYIVERKRKRTRDNYSAPKEIKFK